MTQDQPTPPRGATSRADLLRALAVAPREHLALDIGTDAWFGYVRLAEPPPPAVKVYDIQAPREITVTEPRRRLPLRMPHVYAVVERQPRQTPEPDAPAAVIEEAGPISEGDAKAPSCQRLVGYEDLVPQARLLPALRRLLGSTRAGLLDLDRLIYCLASGQLPRHLPRRRLQRWHPEFVVLFDFSARLWPYREDMHRLAERLLRHCGKSGVSLRIVNHGPFGPWSDWLAHQNVQAHAEPAGRPWAMPPAGTPVLIVSDLGLLHGAGMPASTAWQGFIARLTKAHVRPIALVPLGAGQLDGSQALSLPILRWSPDAQAHPERAHGVGQPRPEGLDDLLAMVAATRRVDPPLLRAMRRLNPQAPLDAGLEGSVWCHADVAAGASASIRTDAQDRHLQHFARLLPRLQVELEQLRHSHHAHLRAVLNHEETWLWRSHAGDVGNAGLPAATRQRMVEADLFMAKLAATLRQPGSLRAAGVWWDVAQGIVQRADADMGERLLTPLVALLAKTPGALAHLPDWVDPAELAYFIGDGREPVRCWLVQDAAKACLLLQARPAGAGQIPLGDALTLDAGGARLRVGTGGSHGRCWLSAGDLPMALAFLGESLTVHLETATEAVTVEAVPRPRGALEWGCDGGGLKVRTAPLAGFEVEWKGDELYAAPNSLSSLPIIGGSVVGRNKPAQAGVSGTTSGQMPETVAKRPYSGLPLWNLEADAKSIDDDKHPLQFGMDSFGVWAELTLSTQHGSATQRFRWIEPGTFLMGSPEGEAERGSDEGPRHSVTLTQGFWLADSACTQALWQAVMGNNPSHFKDNPGNPVENVSWNDVQPFLRKLGELLPGCAAALPTEAEWEYACRAGTGTPFSFGTQITPEQVNYNGNYPYAGGGKGLYREKTVPVKSLPPNAWGLYEMHGNVWEWCADGQRNYDGQPQLDPVGPIIQEGADTPPAVRGGSWSINAGRARSACRYALHPGIASRFRGFRLCLRSIEPSQVSGPPGGRGREAAPTRDEEGAASAKRPFLPERLHSKRKKKK